MSENEVNEPTKRAMEQIKSEYINACAGLGQTVYQKHLLDLEQSQIIDKLKELNMEAKSIEKDGTNGTT
jgi:methionine synthase I (cobalamin-dependent)